MTDHINTALVNLATREDLIHGTRDLVESIKTYTHHSYKKIGEIAGVTEQGVRRWRENDSGQASRVQALITYANSLVAGVNNAVPANGNAADALRSVTPLAVQSSVKHALERLLGIGLATCTIVKLEDNDGKVTLQLMIE
jgi:hypothetical protein